MPVKNKLFRASLLAVNLYAGIFALVSTVRYSLLHQFSELNSWTIGEWAINYQGGFVRRGLAGELLYYFSKSTGIPIWVSATCASILLFVSLLIILFHVTRGVFSRLVIVSTFCLLSPLVGGFLVRKDILLLTFLFSVILFLHRLATRTTVIISPAFLLLALINGIGPLVHESYIFISFPSILLLRKKFDANLTFSPLAFFCVPMIISTVLCFAYPGDASIAADIQRSWYNLSKAIPGVYDQIPSGAIGFLQKTGVDALKYSLSPVFFKVYSGYLYPPMFLVLTFIINRYVLAKSLCLRSQIVIPGLSVGAFFWLYSIFMAPIFIAGHDYGRWFFMINTCTIFMYSLIARPFLSDKSSNLPSLKYPSASVLLSEGSPPYLYYLLLLVWCTPPYWRNLSYASFCEYSTIGVLASSIIDLANICQNNIPL